MCKKTPLFEGDSDFDQLHRIFKVLGTSLQGQCNLIKNAEYEIDNETRKPKKVSFKMNFLCRNDENEYKIVSSDVSFPIYPKKI